MRYCLSVVAKAHCLSLAFPTAVAFPTAFHLRPLWLWHCLSFAVPHCRCVQEVQSLFGEDSGEREGTAAPVNPAALPSTHSASSPLPTAPPREPNNNARSSPRVD